MRQLVYAVVVVLVVLDYSALVERCIKAILKKMFVCSNPTQNFQGG
jgi:hypothetical protein